MISPRAYFDGLERGDRSVEVEGAARLRRACAVVRHGEVTAASDDRSGGALDDLVHDYLVFLFSKAGTAQRLLLDDWKGVTVSFARFLKRHRRTDKSIERQRGLYQELIFDKIRKLVRHDVRFAAVPPARLARFRLATPPASLEHWDEDELRARLPPLASRLEPVGKKSPEVADRAELAAQLTRIFALGGNQPRTVHGLFEYVWSTLSPQPDEAAAQRPPPGEEGAPDVVDGLTGDDHREARSRFQAATDERAADAEFLEERVDELAYGFLASIKRRCADVARCRWATAEGGRMRPHEEVSQALGIPRSTVARDADDFEAALGDFVRRNALDEAEFLILLEVVREILSAGDFQPTEGVER